MKVFKLTIESFKRSCVFVDGSLDGLLEEIRGSKTGEVFTVTVLEMSQEEIDAMPEFDGW